MKRLMAILLVPLLLLLASCGEGTERAKATTEDLLRCVKEGRFEDAAQLTHPSYAATAEEIEALFADAEHDFSVDFSGGMKLYYYNVMSSYRDSGYDGSSWELWAELVVGKRSLDLEIVIVENGAGYGVARLQIDDFESDDGGGASYLALPR